MNKTVIECNGIAAGYVKGLNILQGVDLIVNEKEIVSIIGPNGAGKSTLLKAIMGIINISGGRFFINGVEKTNTPTHQIVNEGVGYVPQVENVFPSLTIEEFYNQLGESVPLGKRVGEAEEAAALITFLSSDVSSYTTGTAINVDGGVSPVV